eukprot:symbB.v1.2.029726.t1/scaffold3288.1/size59728/2
MTESHGAGAAGAFSGSFQARFHSEGYHRYLACFDAENSPRNPPRNPRGADFRPTETFQYASREEERVIKTTLHELGTQREDMKLSLKVYHFQELSRTSIRDAIFERDGRYVQLKKDLQEEVNKLSPAQLVAAMVSCGRLSVRDKQIWWDLARAVERHTVKTRSGASGLQHSQICLTMHALGKANIKIKDRFYYRMLKMMMKRAEIWTEFDMAWILYGMRKRRLRPRNPEQKEHKLWARVLRAVAAYFRQKMHFISPKGIVYILYEFAQHGIFPGAASVGSTFGSKEIGEDLFRATRRIRRHLSSLSNRALVLLAVLLARFDWPEQRLLKKYSAEIRKSYRMARLHPQNLVVILHAYGRLNVRDVELLKSISQQLLKAPDKLEGKYITMVCNSFGRLGVRGPLWQELSQRIRERVDWLAPVDLALIAHGFGKVAIREKEFLAGPFSDAAVASIAGFTPKQLACLLDGLTLAGCLREDLFFATMEEYIRQGSIGGRQRQHMMSRVLFTVMLERKHLLEGVSPAWQPLLSRVHHAPIDAPPRPYHRELATCATALSLKARPRRRKGPYIVDLHVPVEAHVPAGPFPANQFTVSGLAVHLMAEAEFCPITGELLGPTRLRRRHLLQMQWQHLGLRRKDWLALPDTEARVTELESLLVERVPLRRRPVAILEVEGNTTSTPQIENSEQLSTPWSSEKDALLVAKPALSSGPSIGSGPGHAPLPHHEPCCKVARRGNVGEDRKRCSANTASRSSNRVAAALVGLQQVSQLQRMQVEQFIRERDMLRQVAGISKSNTLAIESG